MPNFFVRNAEALRFALPAYVCFVLVVVVTELDPRPCADSWSYFNSLIVLSSFLAVLALGQGRGDPDRRPRPVGALDDRPRAAYCSRAW